MDWRLRMLEWCGPGVLSGIRLGDWLNLLREYRTQIDFSRLPRVLTITVQSLKNSTIGLVERKRYGAIVENTPVQPPIFILGHWRSGTTHLHQLLSQDDRFAFPNSYQTAFPHIFLTFENIDSRLISPFMPKQRPMDNMGLDLASPQEDEFALCSGSLVSSCMQWIFPRIKERFGKYLTLQAVDAAELARWQNMLMTFVKKLQLRYPRPLLLKSPQHTARIRFLLQLFPDAKFVHIHRNPFRVFQSSCRLFHIMFKWHGLQRPNLDPVEDWVLKQYREMYEAFFEQQKLIPAGHYCEIGFEELEQNPLEEMQRLYEALELPDFSVVKPKLSRYLHSLSGYRKNEFSPLPDSLRKRIRGEWSNCFEKWGYSRGADDDAPDCALRSSR